MNTAIGAELPTLQEAHLANGNGEGRVPVLALFQLLARHVCADFDEQWANFGTNLLQALSEGKDDPEVTPSSASAGLFEDAADIDRCFCRRASLVIYFMERLMSGSYRVTAQDCALIAEELKKELPLLVMVELRIPLSNSPAFWSNIAETDPEDIKP
eukprot:8989512-Pyramimonas_sp.AAC.1